MSGDEMIERLRHLLDNATPGAWKLWGMTVMADQDGTNDVDSAVPVAQTHHLDENGKPRTWDASLIAESHNMLPALLDEVDALRAQVERVRALADEIAEQSRICNVGNSATISQRLRDALDQP